MKKSAIILLLGLVACAAAFSTIYFFGTAHYRQMMLEPKPELAWLKKEFKLSDAEFARISQLHEAYLPACRERCMRINELNRKLQQLLAQTRTLTPEIQN